MYNLILCSVPIIFAPLIGILAERSPMAIGWMATLVSVTVLGMVGLHVIPDCYSIWGLWSFVAVGFGFVLILLCEKLYSVLSYHGKLSMVFLAGLTIALHGALDGAALNKPDLPTVDFHHKELVWSIFLHRFVVAAVIWMTAVRSGRGVALTMLAILTFSSIGGYYAGEWINTFDPRSFILLEAFVSGGLLHLVFDSVKLKTQPLWRKA